MSLKIPSIKFFMNNKMALVLIALALYVAVYGNPLTSVQEAFTNNGATRQEIEGPGKSTNPTGPEPVLSTVSANDEEEMEFSQIGATEASLNIPSCAQFVSSNLLPKDDPKLDASFTEFFPAKDLQGQDFIDTNKYAIGMQSQTLRNANLQLRSDPPISNTMECASPWNNTTINAEARRPLTIGSSA